MDRFYGTNLIGMHLIWWIIWMCLLMWIFLTPWKIPGERRKKDSPLDILQKRFASREITKAQYLEDKNLLETD